MKLVVALFSASVLATAGGTVAAQQQNANVNNTGPDSNVEIEYSEECEAYINNNTNISVNNGGQEEGGQDADSGDVNNNQNTNSGTSNSGDAGNSSNLNLNVSVDNSSDNPCAPALAVNDGGQGGSPTDGGEGQGEAPQDNPETPDVDESQPGVTTSLPQTDGASSFGLAASLVAVVSTVAIGARSLFSKIG